LHKTSNSWAVKNLKDDAIAYSLTSDKHNEVMAHSSFKVKEFFNLLVFKALSNAFVADRKFRRESFKAVKYEFKLFKCSH
jgi:hypothetical protein